MAERTLLEITDAIREMAEQNGAYHDKKLNEWFVDGEVPDALVSFVVKEKRRRDYVAETVPQCRRCGTHMTLRNNSTTGKAYWICASVRCGDIRSLEDVGVELKSETGQPEQSAAASVQFQDKVRAARIIARAIELFRDEPKAMAWLESPKVGLRNHGDIPLVAIKTLGGCAITERLLDERFD